MAESENTPTTTEEHQEPNLQTIEETGSVPTQKRKNPEEEQTDTVPNPLWKTSLCSYFRSHSQSCSHGNDCRYAHGEAELRLRPDNSWDPTSERAKKLLKSESGEGVELDPREDICTPTVCENSSMNNNSFPFNKCVVHLPMRWDSDSFKGFLDSEEILYGSAKKKKGMTVGFVGFATSEQAIHATEELDGKSLGNKCIKVADVISRSHQKESRSAVFLNVGNEQDTENNSARDEPAENGDIVKKDTCSVDGLVLKTKTARDVVTPLAQMQYSDQLDHKKNSLLQTLKGLTRNARKANPDGVQLPDWILNSRDIGGLPCKLEGILESPLINGYRNKCEFSVGYSLQGKRTVGFMLGNFRDGVMAVGEPVDCPNVSRISCKFALIFQEFLQSSVLPLWDRVKNAGFWRQFTVREGRRPIQPAELENAEASVAEVMLIIQICSVGIDEKLKKSEFERMALVLALGASASSPPMPLTALVVQDHKDISNAASAESPLFPLPIPRIESLGCPKEHNIAEERIHDYISNLCFSISPTAFFQVNTPAAGKLYALAGDWARLGPNTLVFDICCGTGTIGLTLAHRVGMVVGIEMNASAVSDACRNAEINGIKNCRFVCGKAEHVIGSLLKEYINVQQPQDETSHLVKSNGEHASDDKENCNDSVLDTDACVSNTDSENNACVEMASEFPDGNIGRNFEDKENANETFPPNKSFDQEMDPHSNNEGIETPGKMNNMLQENPTSTTIPQFDDVVAIVDPPRVGLHPTVIKALRTHPGLRRLVYISCNPESLVANAIELCTPSADKPGKGENGGRWRKMSSAGLARHRVKKMPSSEPFRPVKAMAVDMFPHTPHCELVMLLER